MRLPPKKNPAKQQHTFANEVTYINQNALWMLEVCICSSKLDPFGLDSVTYCWWFRNVTVNSPVEGKVGFYMVLAPSKRWLALGFLKYQHPSTVSSTKLNILFFCCTCSSRKLKWCIQISLTQHHQTRCICELHQVKSPWWANYNTCNHTLPYLDFFFLTCFHTADGSKIMHSISLKKCRKLWDPNYQH